MMALVTRVSHPECSARTARHEVGRHSVSFDANGGPLRRQEIARAVLWNRQRSTQHTRGVGPWYSAGHTARSAILKPMGVFIFSPRYLAKTLSAVHTVTLFVFPWSC